METQVRDTSFGPCQLHSAPNRSFFPSTDFSVLPFLTPPTRTILLELLHFNLCDGTVGYLSLFSLC